MFISLILLLIKVVFMFVYSLLVGKIWLKHHLSMGGDLSPNVTHTVFVNFQKNCHILSVHFDDYRLY